MRWQMPGRMLPPRVVTAPRALGSRWKHCFCVALLATASGACEDVEPRAADGAWELDEPADAPSSATGDPLDATEGDAPGEDDTPSSGEPDSDLESFDAVPFDVPDEGGVDAGSWTAPPFCEGPTTFRHDPLSGTFAPPFPDDLYTRDDDLSPTGLRVDLSVERVPWLAVIQPPFHMLVPALGTLDGFTTTGGLFLPFDGPVNAPPSGDVESMESPALLLLELGGGGARRIPFEARLADQGHTIAVWPMVPLRARTLHALVATSTYTALDGSCLAPSATLRQLLTQHSDAPELIRLHGRYAQLLQQAALAPEDVSAAIVFTTQSIEEPSTAVATDVRSHVYEWSGPPTCQNEEAKQACDRVFLANDYSDGRIIVDGSPQGQYALTARFWFPPLDTPRPWPVTIFGHGLGSGREQGKLIAAALSTAGFVTIALDAPMHGDHPTAAGGEQLDLVLSFFGFDLDNFVFDTLHMRDIWKRATADKLQLVELLVSNPDLDGDGTADIATDRLTYLGASLGGIMGSELLAMSDRFDAAILMIAGARLSFMVSEAEQLADFIPIVAPTLTPGELDRVFALAQTVADGGDPANYATHVLRERFEVGGINTPDLLLTMALDDEIVPNATTEMLARALGTPIVPPVLLDVGVVAVEPTTPVVANVNGGANTAGLFQYDRMTMKAKASPKPSEHSNLPLSLESVHQTLHWFHAWWETGMGEIVDPYLELGTPPL